MEQVKLILAISKKYHFWILAVVALVLAFWFYPKASATAQKQFDTRKKAIVGAKKSATSVANDPDHPNDKRIEEWKKLHTIQKLKVLEGWQLLYSKQKKENPWPSILSDEFRTIVKQLDTYDEIPRHYRVQYWTFIGDALPHLWKIVDYRCQLGPDGKSIDDMIDKKGGRSADRPSSQYSGGDAKVKWAGVVDWDVADRLRIQEEFNFDILPSSLNVRLAQESYWVYQALANIIKRTNGEAKTQSSAVVKSIHAMEIGQAASAFFQSDTRPSLIPGVELGAEGDMDEGGESENTLGDIELSDADLDLLNTRYVNESLIPQEAGEHPYAEFKMMPIRLQLSVDQRKLPDLLVECANSSMPVEVRQLRLNPEKALILSSSGASDGAQYSLTSGVSSSGSKKASSGYGSSATEKKSSYEVIAEIRGIIYIYNPPDLKKLGTGAVTEASLEEGKAAAEETVAAAEAALDANTGDSEESDSSSSPAEEKAPAKASDSETDQPAEKNSDGDSQ
jgi:hypothetical protein